MPCTMHQLRRYTGAGKKKKKKKKQLSPEPGQRNPGSLFAGSPQIWPQCAPTPCPPPLSARRSHMVACETSATATYAGFEHTACAMLLWRSTPLDLFSVREAHEAARTASEISWVLVLKGPAGPSSHEMDKGAPPFGGGGGGCGLGDAVITGIGSKEAPPP